MTGAQLWAIRTRLGLGLGGFGKYLRRDDKKKSTYPSPTLVAQWEEPPGSPKHRPIPEKAAEFMRERVAADVYEAGMAEGLRLVPNEKQ